jgi:flagellar hook-associated protein 3 FlgL
VQASNTVNNQGARNDIAAEIRQLSGAIRSHANAKIGSDYIFSGTSTATAPYPIGQNTYQGNANQISRRVAPGQQMQVNMASDSIFGTTTGATPGTMNTFDLLDRIVSDLQSGQPADIQELSTAVLDALDTNIDSVLRARATLGSQSSQLETLSSQMTDLQGRLADIRSNIVNADMSKTYVEFQQQTNAYQAALAAGSKMMNVSLLDFLR